jgi:hypothetical protein
MFLNTRCIINHKPVVVIVRHDTESRLAKTCFRGPHLKVAGNFSSWANCGELFKNRFIVSELVNDAREALRVNERTNSVTIALENLCGWSGTDGLGKYNHRALERFEPNRRSFAWRVRTHRRDLLAPRTHILTVVYELKEEADKDQIAVIVHSIYPGSDIGELVGDITQREKRIFFDWNHPGAE